MDITPANTNSICGAQAGTAHLSYSQRFCEMGVHVSSLLIRKPRLREGRSFQGHTAEEW